MAMEQSELIGQLLVQKGVITPQMLERALAEQDGSKGFLGETLIRLGFVDEEKLYKALAEQMGVEYIKLKNTTIDPAVINQIPAKFACHYKLMPIALQNDTITIATANPVDIHTTDDIKLLLRKEIRTVLASEKDIVEAIKKYYGVGADTIDRMSPDMSPQGLVSVQAQETQDLIDPSEEASIVKFVNQILLEAYRERATDVHLEPYEDEFMVRYRIDGILYDTKVPPTIKNFQSAIISRIKIMANLNIAEQRLPQDGRIKIKIGDEEVDLRVSILPTPFGESVVIRVLSTNILFGMEKLGLHKDHLDIMERLIQKPHGIIFVTGPTGSGKTTTLYAVFNRINDRKKKIITIEDPIEYDIEGISQIQVIPKIGFTFAQGLRSILRHDPDVLMVGEIRDFETAELAIRSALTGHLIFSTLHTNDAPGGVARLLNIGIEPYLVASSLAAFISQRLVRLICPDCKMLDQDIPKDVISGIIKEISKSKAGLNNIKAETTKIYKGKGCKNCNFTGFKGRTAIYEILVVDKAIRELILKKESTERVREEMINQGMNTLRLSGWQKVIEGVTTPEEIIRVTQIIE